MAEEQQQDDKKFWAANTPVKGCRYCYLLFSGTYPYSKWQFHTDDVCIERAGRAAARMRWNADNGTYVPCPDLFKDPPNYAALAQENGIPQLRENVARSEEAAEKAVDLDYQFHGRGKFKTVERQPRGLNLAEVVPKIPRETPQRQEYISKMQRGHDEYPGYTQSFAGLSIVAKPCAAESISGTSGLPKPPLAPLTRNRDYGSTSTQFGNVLGHKMSMSCIDGGSTGQKTSGVDFSKYPWSSAGGMPEGSDMHCSGMTERSGIPKPPSVLQGFDETASQGTRMAGWLRDLPNLGSESFYCEETIRKQNAKMSWAFKSKKQNIHRTVHCEGCTDEDCHGAIINKATPVCNTLCFHDVLENLTEEKFMHFLCEAAPGSPWPEEVKIGYSHSLRNGWARYANEKQAWIARGLFDRKYFAELMLAGVPLHVNYAKSPMVPGGGYTRPKSGTFGKSAAPSAPPASETDEPAAQ